MIGFSVYLHALPGGFSHLPLEELEPKLMGNEIDLGESFEILSIPASKDCLDWVEAGVDLKAGFGFYGGRWLLRSEQIREKLGPNFEGGDYVIAEVWDQS